jgi:hypothetical protein
MAVRRRGRFSLREDRRLIQMVFDRFWPECRNTCSYDGSTAEKILSKVVVEHANAIRVRRHGCVSIVIEELPAPGLADFPARLEEQVRRRKQLGDNSCATATLLRHRFTPRSIAMLCGRSPALGRETSHERSPQSSRRLFCGSSRPRL